MPEKSLKEFLSKGEGFGEMQVCTFINHILYKCPPWKNISRKHTVKYHVFLPVGLGNLQLHSLGIKPVNIILDLAHAVVRVQVLLHSVFDQFNFIK